MLFNSFHFAVFFPIVLAMFFVVLRGRLASARWVMLLLASYYFYMSWRSEYILLILASTTIDYVAGHRIAEAEHKIVKRTWLLTSIITNLGVLFTFKYLAFFAESGIIFFQSIGLETEIPSVNLLLPVGISFYTFQTMSYTIDVYRGDIEPERRLGVFALFVSFFPQLVAGPIERSSSLLPQLRNLAFVRFDYARVTSGLKLMAWGLFKKVVIADRIAYYVNQVFNAPGQQQGLPIIIGTVLFAYQIYCDFSGYSDMAIGAARILGVDLHLNFDRPYFATSIQDFWGRWHISLSTWFRDYVYIPLGGNRVSLWRYHFNVMVTFLLSGLWHGANWTFVIWGAIHGGMYILSHWFTRFWGSVPGSARPQSFRFYVQIALQQFITFIVVCFGWMFFRANRLSDVGLLLQGIADYGDGWWQLLPPLPVWYAPFEIYIGFALVASLALVEALDPIVNWTTRIDRAPGWVRFALYYILIMSIIFLGEFDVPMDFIYFQF